MSDDIVTVQIDFIIIIKVLIFNINLIQFFDDFECVLVPIPCDYDLRRLDCFVRHERMILAVFYFNVCGDCICVTEISKIVFFNPLCL